MIEKLRTSWRSYREKRREYQLERALYKAGGHRGARHGGFDSGVMKEPEDLSRIPPTAPGGP